MRIGAGNFHALRYTWRLLNPMAGAVALAFWSHKVCRWLVPLILAAALFSSAMLGGRTGVRRRRRARPGVPAARASWDYRLDLRARYWAPASIPYYFLSMNLALLFGLIRLPAGHAVDRLDADRSNRRCHSWFFRVITRTAADVVSDQRVAGAVTRAEEIL